MKAYTSPLASFEARRKSAEHLRMRSCVLAARFFCVRVLHNLVIARSGSDAAIQIFSVHNWIASLSLAMTTTKDGNDDHENKRKRNAGRRICLMPARKRRA